MSERPGQATAGREAAIARLRERALSGARWTSMGAAARVALQFIQLAVLARLLLPSDFGNMAVVFAVVAVAQILSDAGVSSAIFSRDELSPSQRSSLYWLNMAVSAVLALILVAAGPWLASFYGEPALRHLLAASGLYLIITASWQQLRVVAEKELRFESLAKIEVAGALAGLLVAVAMAWMGAGVFALMGGVLAVSATSAVLAWRVLARGWRPQPVFRLAEIRDYLAFGAYMVGNDLANAASFQADVVLGARLLGAPAIGFYSVPKNLCVQIVATVNPVLTRVGLPVMASARADRALLKTVYLRTMRMAASANCPIFLALAIFAPEVVHLLFGPRWDTAIPLLQWLAGWALLRSIVNPVGGLLVAVGRADLAFRWNLVWLAICVPAVLAGCRFGVGGLAAAVGLVGLAAMAANWYFLVRPLCGAAGGEYFGEIAVPLAIAAAAGLAGTLAAAPFSADVARLVAGLAAAAAAYAALSIAFNRAWVRLVRELLSPG